MCENISDNLVREIQELIATVTGKNIELLKPEANLWTEVGVDSIKSIEIVVAIEKKYKIRVKDEDIPKISNIAQMVELLKAALKEKSNEA